VGFDGRFRSGAYPRGGHEPRRILVFLSVVSASLMTPATAQAGGVGTHDPGHRLDVRWVGVFPIGA
jgi:hypothetical protein